MDESDLKILFMDDEEIVRHVVGKMLGIMGYGFELAADGEEAVEAYRKAFEAGRSFDIVILDWHVEGGKGGAEAIAELREIDPKVVAVASSGDIAVLTGDRATGSGFAATISKPYSMTDLQNCISKTLGLTEKI
jgi:CheY-like chemotaxis protein